MVVKNNGYAPKFRKRILLDQNRLTNSDSYALWTDIVPLCRPNSYLLGNFVFEFRSYIIQPRQRSVRLI